ncbi:25808_t:CDS:2, partial [Gigaspora rosea]
MCALDSSTALQQQPRPILESTTNEIEAGNSQMATNQNISKAPKLAVKQENMHIKRTKSKRGPNKYLDNQIEELKVQMEDETTSLARRWRQILLLPLYKTEGIDKKAAEEITTALPQITESMNKSLSRKITQEEIRN